MDKKIYSQYHFHCFLAFFCSTCFLEFLVFISIFFILLSLRFSIRLTGLKRVFSWFLTMLVLYFWIYLKILSSALSPVNFFFSFFIFFFIFRFWPVEMIFAISKSIYGRSSVMKFPSPLLLPEFVF